MNILDSKLELCSKNPLTVYYRDGYCRTDKNDFGKHTICAEMNKEFLEFTKSKGNNLYSVVKEGENGVYVKVDGMNLIYIIKRLE